MATHTSTLTEMCDEYIQWLNDEDKSDSFIKNSISTLRRFAAQFDALNAENVSRFIRQHSPTTANSYLARLQSFAKFHDVNISRATRRREVKEEPVALTAEEVQQLINDTMVYDDQLAHIITVLSETGLRIHEFLQLNGDSIDGSSSPMITVLGKGMRKRTIPLTKRAHESLLAIHFPLARQEQAICRAISAAAELAKLPMEVTPHTLRRTFASIALNDKNMSPMDVCKVGGWSNMQNLSKYYHKASLSRIALAMNG